MFTRLPSVPIGVNAAASATTPPVTVVETWGVLNRGCSLPDHLAEGAHFAVSPAGVLLTTEAAPSRSSFAWIADGRDQAAADLDRVLTGAVLSSDGGRLAGLDDGDGARADIWIADLLRSTTTRLTHGGLNTAPVWSRNALYYATTSGRGPYEIWRRETESPAPGVRIHAASAHVFPAAVTPDGRTLAFVQKSETTRTDLWLLPLDGGTPTPLAQSPFDEWGAAFSPDGKFAAYQSTEGGRWDVYAQRLADRRRVLVSRTGATRPLWAPDGSALYYQAGRDIMRAPFDGRVDLQFGPAVQVAAIGDAEMIDIDRSGRVLTRRLPLQPTSVVFALNWMRELRQQLGPPPAFMPR
jgi:Tol biopolymer transport system component